MTRPIRKAVIPAAGFVSRMLPVVRGPLFGIGMLASISEGMQEKMTTVQLN